MRDATIAVSVSSALAPRRPATGASEVVRIIPQGWREMQVTGAAQREIETLARLAAGLQGELTVIHGVHWTRLDHGAAAYGEIDFVIVSGAARILLVQQKSGFLTETSGGIVGTYPGGHKRVATELARTLDALRGRLAPLLHGEEVAIDYMLYCPDYTIRDPGSAGIPPEYIVDATRRDRLCAQIMSALPAEAPNPALASRLVRFFADQLQLVPDVSALLGRAEQLVTRLSGGLATWARRLEFEPFRLHVVGTAGSGKTQLAAALLHDAAAAGRRALYICFNRPLADHLAAIVPHGDRVLTFHQWCDRALRRSGVAIDYGRADAFDDVERAIGTLPVREDERVDEIIIDEGQDLEPAWRDVLLQRLGAGGRAWWLEDPLQGLYHRANAQPPGWVRLRADTNYRSPRAIARQIGLIVPAARDIEPASPFIGNDVEYLSYADAGAEGSGDPALPHGLAGATHRAVTHALQGGLRLSDIAIVTFSGRDRSRLLRLERLGQHRLRSWTGRYDLLGTPEYRAGDLTIETVYRFKGQSAPCVILAEVDFERLDEMAERKLFVGMTRATMRLFVVASDRAAAAIASRIAAGPARGA